MQGITLFFDYQGFQTEANPLIEQADIGNVEMIIKRAKSIVDSQSTEWILEGLGTSVTLLNDPPGPWLTGFAFLVLLSKYLKPNPFGYGSTTGLVRIVVDYLGWDQYDVKLLKNGMTTANLFKPELVADPLNHHHPDDQVYDDPATYWWWVSPRAYNTGWLNTEQIRDLYYKLIEVRTDYEQVDTNELNLHPSVTKSDLLKQYQQSIKLFKAAFEAEVGLFDILV